MGGKRMPLSKDARKYRKIVEDLREEMAKMQVRSRSFVVVCSAC